MCIRKLRIVVTVWCLAATISGQALFLPWHAVAQGDVGRPPLPDGIVRLPFDGRVEITQVPGCGWHNRNNKNPETGYNVSPESQEQNDRAFDFGLADGTPVLAAGEGDVISTDVIGGALRVGIAHGRWENGTFVHNGVRSFYLHLQEFVDGGRVGDHVQVGQLVGLSGRSGGVPPHLHFSVTENGVAANINSLPGIPWENEQLNEAGYAICNDQARDYAVGGAVAQPPGAPGAPGEMDQPTLVAIGYDRNAAVNAAFGALHENYRFENDSANFVSKALWGGGLPQTDEWTQIAAANPDDLVNYLLTTHRIDDERAYLPATSTRIDWSDNTAQGAQRGDVIAYDWEGDGIIDHVAIVTNINSDGYPEVSQHSPTQENQYWSYSEAQGNWIEFAFPGSVAYLIRIEPLTTPLF